MEVMSHEREVKNGEYSALKAKYVNHKSIFKYQKDHQINKELDLLSAFPKANLA